MHHLMEDLMTGEVVTVGAGALYREVVARMKRHAVNALPVVDRYGALVDIVSSADLLLKQDVQARDDRLLGDHHRRRDQAKAAATMARADVHSDRDVGHAPDGGGAARLLHRHGVRQPRVVDDAGRRMGIVSRGDLLKVFLREDDGIRREATEEILGKPDEPATSEVRMEAIDGIVRLDGYMERQSDLDTVVALVRAVDGVVAVDSRVNCGIHAAGPPWRQAG